MGNDVVRLRVGLTTIMREYHTDDPIWSLVTEKAHRQLLADVQRDLAKEADKRAKTKVTERG